MQLAKFNRFSQEW